ncbi:MAG: germination protein YpeB, partial [Clostridiales bacterium]|nr:germination protein YpeB [Clostridiales bacterium]
ALNSYWQSVGLENCFSTTEEALVDYPTLIYDGPFSDHLVNQTPQMTKNLEEVSRNDAQSAVKDLSGVNTDDLAYQGMEESNLPCYVFTTETSTIGVTQKGGLLCYILNTAAIEESNVSTEDAIKNAEQFLEDNGFSDMTVSYYANNGNTLIINFAYEQNGVIFYSDLIKVGVALDDGRIVSFDGRGYITNHKNRVLDTPQYSVEEALAVLSPYLEVTSAREAVIPTTTDAEVYAYEFHCKSKSTGDEILVYIDTQTCQEEDILFLLYTDDGVFVK